MMCNILILQCLCIIWLSLGSLWQFKRDEIEENNNLTVDDSSSFKYKSNVIGNLSQVGTRNNVKIVIPLKYLSNFWRLLEMPLINCWTFIKMVWKLYIV